MPDRGLRRHGWHVALRLRSRVQPQALPRTTAQQALHGGVRRGPAYASTPLWPDLQGRFDAAGPSGASGA